MVANANHSHYPGEMIAREEAERRSTVVRVLLDRACDDLAQLQHQLLEEELDRGALRTAVSDASYLVHLAIEELDA